MVRAKAGVGQEQGGSRTEAEQKLRTGVWQEYKRYIFLGRYKPHAKFHGQQLDLALSRSRVGAGQA